MLFVSLAIPLMSELITLSNDTSGGLDVMSEPQSFSDLDSN